MALRSLWRYDRDYDDEDNDDNNDNVVLCDVHAEAPKFLPKFYPKKRVITTFATKKARNHDICDKKSA